MSRARDSKLLDALESLAAKPFDGVVWRVVRQGRDPLVGSSVGGRWDDKTFDALYTSQTAEGALSETYFHLSRGQPVIPSQVNYQLFEIAAEIPKCIELPTLEDLLGLGLRTETYGQLCYDERHAEYPRTQEIAEAVYFLGHEGLSVPSARHASKNLVIFTERVPPGNLSIIRVHETINWEAWRSGGYNVANSGT
jgi:RES domain-containing protein